MVDSMIGTAPRDWDEACDAVSDAYFPHTLTPLSRHAASGVGVCTAELGPLRIAHIRWGADVAVESEHPGAYGVNIPLSGELESVFAGSHVLSRYCQDLWMRVFQATSVSLDSSGSAG
ncbi:hypothetical protein R3Q08_20155, partial [Rhodococcus erythropolis]|nr:hypothetical protein [Rhodococcus erythropolis]